MKYFLYITLLFCTPTLLAQSKKQLDVEKELKEIVKEADMLFTYRMVEWWGSEFTEDDKELDRQVSDYLIYHDSDKFYFVLIDDSYKNKAGTYFIDFNNEEANIQFDSTQSKLNKQERKLYQIQNRMNLQASELVKKELVEKEGFSVSTILIKQKRGYKLYLLSNTRDVDVIPLGNDAVFHGNNRGKIKKWNWYHKELLPIPISREGIRLATHKHGKSQPLISPTEIANFRLYGLLYGMLNLPILIENEGLLLEYESYDNRVNAYYPKQ